MNTNIKRLSNKKNFLYQVYQKYKIDVNLIKISCDNFSHKILKEKYPKADDIYVIQNLFKKS